MHYAKSAILFVEDKVARFGGCDFRLHLNEEAAAREGLLQRLREAARGRIEFAVYAFTPRPKVAPWLLAAMRIGPLLSTPGRTVATMDIHDDPELQNAQVRRSTGAATAVAPRA